MMLPYIINVALLLVACLAFYKVLLRRETFYRVNRFLLMGCLALAFLLPLLTVPAEYSLRKVDGDSQQQAVAGVQSTVGRPQQSVGNGPFNLARQQAVIPDTKKQKTEQDNAVINPLSMNDTEKVTHINPVSMDQVVQAMIWFYWFGVIVFGASFLFQLGLLCWRSFRNPVIIDGRYRIVEMNGDQAPCSFGNRIFINPAKYDWETFNQILLHEKIHIQQRHTLDIVLAELVLVFQWFNPFAWIYRREIENNLEYLTDDQLVKHPSVNKQHYQLSLLRVAAPHIPLGLTSNYNQSTLKKRIAMMNTKRSNVHTAWKYLFLLPVLVFLVCLLNKPGTAGAQTPPPTETVTKTRHQDPGTEGYWFAVIKGEEVTIRFSSEKLDKDDDPETGNKKGKSFSGTDFKLSELGNYPKGTAGTFYITREAGKLEMNGKFEGNTGMGTYKFIVDNAYVDYMNKELADKLDEDDQMAFFMINIKKDYLKMLHNEGFSKVTRDDIIPMAALQVDAAYIRSIKNAGYKDVTMENLVPLKALGIDAAYIKDIRESGIKNMDLDKLVSFKAQGIDKEYIGKVKAMKYKEGKDLDDEDADEIVSYKAMGIDDEFINSFKSVGLSPIPHDQLVAFKALGVTPAYIKSWQDAGYKDINPEEYVGMKSQEVTPEYLKSFEALGYKHIKPENLVAFRALGVTPEYVKSFEAMGYKNIDLEELPGLKSQGVTPETIKSYEALGFKNIDLDEMISVKAMGVTPEYIKEMRAKGMNYDKLEKYVRLKAID